MGGFAAFANLIPKLPDFAGAGMNYAIFRKQRDDYASQVRHLRRREYQDMMFSMRKAGLNPMLASGAQPNHASGYVAPVHDTSTSAGVGTALAAGKTAQAKHEEVVLKGRIIKSQQREIDARAGESEANKALIEQKQRESQQATAESAARETYSREQALTEVSRRAELEARAAEAGASRAKMEAEKRKIEKEIPPIYGDAVRNPVGTAMEASGAAKRGIGHMISNAQELLGEWGKGARLEKEYQEKQRDLEFLRKARGQKR